MPQLQLMRIIYLLRQTFIVASCCKANFEALPLPDNTASLTKLILLISPTFGLAASVRLLDIADVWII
jgi:hypothetical protein